VRQAEILVDVIGVSKVKEKRRKGKQGGGSAAF
jgi:hypothetical protein